MTLLQLLGDGAARVEVVQTMIPAVRSRLQQFQSFDSSDS
jgi:hypothetical protein